MITINLRGEAKRGQATYTLQIGGYLLVLAVLALSMFVLYTNTAATLEEKLAEQTALQTQLDRMKVVTKEVRDLETKKKELGERLAVIATLKKNKIGPVKVLDDLNLSIPEKAWLTNVHESGGPKFTISGMALDNQTIANFMRQLDVSDYFNGVELVETKQKTWQGVNIKEFTLEASIAYGGKILPLTQDKPTTPPVEGGKS